MPTKVIPLLVQLLLVVSTASTARGSAGDLDRSFSGDGIVQRRFGRMPTSIAALVRAPNGNIVAAANVGCRGGQDVAIAGFDSAGALDRSFGDGGMGLIDTGRPIVSSGSDEITPIESSSSATGSCSARPADSRSASTCCWRASSPTAPPTRHTELAA